MRLQSIELYGVGRHRGMVLSHLGPGFTVVYGANEAGKSTLLAGLRGVLFGKVVTGEPGIALAKGAEGRIVVEAADGQKYAIERTLGRKSPPKITCPSGEVLSGQEVLKSLLPELQTVEDVVYQSVFTFQLAELTDFAQADQAIQSRIFAVGMMGKQSPLQIETSLLGLAKEIYNPHRRARNPKLVQCLVEMDDLRQALRDKRDTPVEFEQIQQRLAACKESFALVEKQISVLQKQRALLLKDKAALALHQNIIRWRERLQAAFPEPVVTEEQKAAHRDWTLQRDACHEQVLRLTEECEALQERLASIQIDEPYIHALPHLRTLFGAASGVQEQLRQASEKEREIAELQHSLSAIRAQLSPCWLEGQLDTVRLGADIMEAAEHAQSELQALARERESIGRTVASHQFGLQRRREELERHGVNHAIAADELAKQLALCHRQASDITADEEKLQDLSHHLEMLQPLKIQRIGMRESLAQVGQAKARPARLSAMLWLLAAVCLILCGLETQQVGWILAVPVGMVGVLMAGLALYVTKRTAGDRPQMRDARQVERQLQALDAQISGLEERAQTLSAAIVCVNVAWDQVDGVHSARRSLRELREANAEKKQWVQLVQQLLRDIDGVQYDLNRAVMEGNEIREQMDRVQRGWSQSLHAIGIAASELSPGVFLKEAELVLQARTKAKTIREKEADKRNLEQSIWMFLTSVEDTLIGLESNMTDGSEVAGSLATPEGALPASIGSWLERIERAIQCAEQQAQSVRDKRTLEHQLERSRQSLQAELEKQQKIDGQMQAMYEALRIRDGAAFQQLLEADRERTQCETSLRDCLSEVYGLYGGRELYEERIAVLNETSGELMDERLEQLADEERGLKEQSLGIAKQMGELERRLREWEDGPSTMELEWRLSMAKAERSDLAHRWATYTLAASMIREAREKFELSHRPESLIYAGDLFRKITGERYTGFRVRADDKGVTHLLCLDGQGREWDLGKLSRGTREQVYLALRMAVIQDYRNRGTQLPVVLDDVMVNFDDSRLNEFLKLLQENAKDAQFIYLTCQADVARYAAANDDIAMVTLN